jgi:molecular chaperone DnaJ
MARDYYETLGISKGADDAAIKAAYRRLAMQYHPDRNAGNKDAEAKFKEINEAYDVLKDPQKKAAYDRMGHSAFQQGAQGGYGPGGGGNPFGGGRNPFEGMGGGPGGSGGFEFNGNFEDLFEDILGGMFGGGQQQTRRTRVSRGADLRYNLQITLEQAYKGYETKVSFPTLVTCETCHGNGAKPGTKPVTCPTCNGAGSVQFRQGFFSMSRPCPDCEGTGQVVKDKCPDCKGRGRKQETRTLTVKVPPGVDDGTRLRLAGEGEAGTSGGPAGDLFVFLSVTPHPLFTREGPDLLLDLPLSVFDALLGTQVEVPTPDGGKTTVTVPENTAPETVLRLRGKGMPHLGSPRSHGDLLLRVGVHMPAKLSKKQRDTLAELRDEVPAPAQPESFRKRLAKFWGK